jgi:hypothetical protein
MNTPDIKYSKWNYDANAYKLWHKLVVAEAGFSMLDIHAQQVHGLDGKVTREFADLVNRSGEAGSLYPSAPISAFPRWYFRDIEESEIPIHIARFRRIFEDFLQSNRQTIQAKKLLIDLHVCPRPVSKIYLAEIDGILNDSSQNSGIDEVVIVE